MNIINNSYPVTTEAAQWIAEFDSKAITERAYDFAKHALLDVLGCGIAGQSEPLVAILREEFMDDISTGSQNHKTGDCTLVASDMRTNLHNAAFINGAAMHALDYDDVHFRLHGHPTTCIAPATLALGEKLGASGRDVLTAFIIGTEVACALGEMCEEGHYEAGFHATGTMGTFGAAAAAARLLGLDASATANALGIAASQAAGLKANFGTMTKPFHAGKAAMNGVMSARLAARGFTANPSAIEAPQGFAQAQVSDFKPTPVRPNNAAAYAVEELLYKYHASCYLTHSTLNAIQDIRHQHNFTADDVETATLKVRSTHSSVCCIPQPTSGLEIKFSIQHLAAMGLDGADTSALKTFSTENATDIRYQSARNNVHLDFTENMPRTASEVTVVLKGGQTLSAKDDVGIPNPNAKDQWQKLSAKFHALVTPVLGSEKTTDLISEIINIESSDNIGELMKAAG